MAENGAKTPSSAVVGVITTAISAVATVGFVAFTGAAIAWVRFYSAQLPPDQAVAVMPREELVAIGASALVIFVFFGLLAVLLLYVTDDEGKDVEDVRWALIALAALEGIAAVLIAADRGDGWKGPAAACAAVVVAALVVFVAFLAPKTSVLVAKAEAPATGESGRQDASAGKGTASGKLTDHRKDRRKLTKRGRLVVTAAAALAIIGVPVLMGKAADGPAALGAVIAVAGLLAVANFGVAHASGDRFSAVAVSVFFSVLVFGALLAGARTLQSPFVQPAALIRSDDLETEGVFGVYVAETDDRVWLGVVCQREGHDVQSEQNKGRIFWIAKKDVVALSIGPFQRLRNAQANAAEMLTSLIALRIPVEKAAKRAARDPAKEPAVRKATACAHDNAAPTADVAIRRVPGQPRVLLLDATGSTDDDGTIEGYEWDIAGVKRRRPVVSHPVRRGRTRTQTITLTVTDDEKKASKPRTIKILAPVIARQLFKTDKAKLLQRGKRRLSKRLGPTLGLGKEQLLLVQIEGHTDSRGTRAHNRRLARRRAAAVERFLEREFELRKRLIDSRGFGERVPRASNETRAGRRKNRRVEVLVVRRSG